MTRELQERLRFLKRVIEKEIGYLDYSLNQISSISFDVENTERLSTDHQLAETVEAFTSRFARLQDTVGDKLLPNWLKALGEQTGAVIDNLDRAEKLGMLTSADSWLEMRQLRNLMVHEYIESPEILGNALESAKAYCPIMVKFSHNLLNDLTDRGMLAEVTNDKGQG